MLRPSIDMLREPDQFASAGDGRRVEGRPTAADMARLLCGLSDFTLKSVSTTSGTISTKARKTGPAFSLNKSRHGQPGPTVFP